MTGVKGLQWDSTRQLNGGTAPTLTDPNAELQMCDNGEVWSKGGTCFPSSRSLSLTTDPSLSFTLSNTGEYSFVLWFKMESALESTSLLKFNSGETEVAIAGGTSQIIWSRADATMNLALLIDFGLWIQAGGFYKSGGVYFFANANSDTLSSVSAVLGLDVSICESMSLSTSNLRLHLLSIWNSKQSLSTLKLVSAN